MSNSDPREHAEPTKAVREDVSSAHGTDGRLTDMDDATPIVGLQADPGVPERIAAAIADELAEQIFQTSGQRWRVEVSAGEMPLAPDGTIPLGRRAPRVLEEQGWTYLVYLTDLPRYLEGRPVVCEMSTEVPAALVSLPPLGATRTVRRTRDLAAALVGSALESSRPDASAIEAALGGGKVVQTVLTGEQNRLVTARADRFEATRMLAGMLRSNRPGQLLSAMTGCTAVAIAVGAFGIFYGTLAPVADALSSLRLLLISALVICVLTGWLIIANQLWSRQRTPGQMWRHRLDNASTVITVGVSVVLMYAVLFIVMLVLCVAVIDISFLRSQVMHPIGIGDYLGLAWLSASMGALAGALGTNVDSADSVREATYSRRYHQRRELFDTYENEQADE